MQHSVYDDEGLLIITLPCNRHNEIKQRNNMANGNRIHAPPSRRPRQGSGGPVRRAIRHHGIRHGEKIFVGVLALICLEIGVFTRLYTTIVPSNVIEHRRTETAESQLPPTSIRSGLGSAGSLVEPQQRPSFNNKNKEIQFQPRKVYLTDNNNNIEVSHKSPPQPLEEQKRRQIEPMGDPHFHSSDPYDFVHESLKPFYEKCTPMAQWQTQFYPTCNMIHELPLIDSEDLKMHKQNTTHEPQVTLINSKGSWRSVWKVSQQFREHENDPSNVVLKTLKFNRDFDFESFYLQNIDSIAMERLTSSPYVANEHGFCGESVLTEYAPNSGRDMIKNKKLKTWERVQIAHDLAHALSDMHSIDFPNASNPTLTHNDINIANTIQGERGRIKFNDFNIGVLLRWNKTKPCGYPARFPGPLWRSPEEILAFNTSTYVDVTKTDVYGLGNVLFQVLTTHQPWTWLEPGGRPTIEQVIEKKLNGSLPFVPPKFNATNKTGILALYYATISCFAYNPHDRPTSYQLSHALRIALDWAKENKPVPREEVENLFHFHHKPRTKFSIENEIERRAKLLEESSSKVTVHLQHQANATTNNHKKHRPTMDPELFSNKTKELLKEKNRQIQAAEARRRLIERRKAVPRPKIALRVH